MCGIFAFFSLEESLSEAQVEEVQRSLSHRGPDGKGAWRSASERHILAHTRLSIIDLSTGQQPIQNEDGTIVAVVNGEFYGFEDIQCDLLKRGHHFQTHSDSEILVHLYEEYGVDCLRFLRGEFAFAVWDERKQQALVARDRFGIKPLCFTERHGTLLLASEAKALFAAGIVPEWDQESLFQSLSSQYVLPARTLFRGIHQVEPGHFLVWQEGSISQHRYWDLEFDREQGPVSYVEAASEVREPLQEAIHLRLRADVPVCCHLSGGLDSSIVAISAADSISNPLQCFCVTFDDPDYDESSQAKQLTEEIGASFVPVRIDERAWCDALLDGAYFSEGLAINGHFVGKRLLNRAIAGAGFKVALTGEGADEVFAGYAHLRQDLAQMTGDTSSTRAIASRNTASSGIMIAEGGGLELDLRSVQSTLGFIPSFLRAKAALGARVHSYVRGDFLQQFHGVDCFASYLEALPAASLGPSIHPVHRSMYMWTKLALANYILRTLGDGMEMSASVEGRLPFLDHILVEKVMTLPVGYKIRPSSRNSPLQEKQILRDAFSDRLPASLYHREKHPFVSPPLGFGASGPVRDFTQDLLHSQAATALGVFDLPKVRSLVHRYSERSPDERKQIDPVLYTVVTALCLQQRFRPGW